MRMFIFVLILGKINPVSTFDTYSVPQVNVVLERLGNPDIYLPLILLRFIGSFRLPSPLKTRKPPCSQYMNDIWCSRSYFSASYAQGSEKSKKEYNRISELWWSIYSRVYLCVHIAYNLIQRGDDPPSHII